MSWVSIKKIVLEHDRQKALVLSVQLGRKNVQEQAVLIATGEISSLGALVAGGSGINGGGPAGSDGHRGSETQRSNRGFGVTNALETETKLVTVSSDKTQRGNDLDLASGVVVGAKRREETKARTTILDRGRAIVQHQGVTLCQVVGIAGASVDIVLGHIGGDLGQHLCDRGEGAALGREKKLSKLDTGGSTSSGDALIREHHEGERGSSDLEVVINQDLDTVENSLGRGARKRSLGCRVGGVDIGGNSR